MRIKKRRKNYNGFIFLLLLLSFSLTIGYASFSDNLKISGTANANGRFNIEFTNAKIIDAKGINVIASRAQISADKKELSINIADMQYPGSGATVSCIVQNKGTVPAKLKGIDFTGNNDKDISIIFNNNDLIGKTMQVNDMWTMEIIVKWNIDSSIETRKALNFNISLDYEQDVAEYLPDI